MSRQTTTKGRAFRTGDPLTRREVQILAFVAAGLPTAAISQQLGIAENTIKSHLTSVYRKTGSRNRVQAARHYLEAYGAPRGAPAPLAVERHDRQNTSPIAHQMREIEARLDALAPASPEAKRLRDALRALRDIERD